MKHLLRLCASLYLLAVLALDYAAGAQGISLRKPPFAAYGEGMWSNYSAGRNNSGLSSNGGCIGFGGGGFYNFPIESRFTAGIDVRGAFSPCVRGGSMGAVQGRFGFVPEHFILRPYFGLGLGLVHSKSTSESYYVTQNGTVIPIGNITKLGVALSFGLDVRLTHSLDLRAIELAGAAGGATSSSEAAMGSLGSGLVYRFGH